MRRGRLLGRVRVQLRGDLLRRREGVDCPVRWRARESHIHRQPIDGAIVRLRQRTRMSGGRSRSTSIADLEVELDRPSLDYSTATQRCSGLVASCYTPDQKRNIS